MAERDRDAEIKHLKLLLKSSESARRALEKKWNKANTLLTLFATYSNLEEFESLLVEAKNLTY